MMYSRSDYEVRWGGGVHHEEIKKITQHDLKIGERKIHNNDIFHSED